MDHSGLASRFKSSCVMKHLGLFQMVTILQVEFNNMPANLDHAIKVDFALMHNEGTSIVKN